MNVTKLTAASEPCSPTAPADASYQFDYQHQQLEDTIEHSMTVTDDPEVTRVTTLAGSAAASLSQC